MDHMFRNKGGKNFRKEEARSDASVEIPKTNSTGNNEGADKIFYEGPHRDKVAGSIPLNREAQASNKCMVSVETQAVSDQDQGCLISTGVCKANGEFSEVLNQEDLVGFNGSKSGCKEGNQSTDVGSVDTGYSVIVDQRVQKTDTVEVSSPKHRKWKRLARAKMGVFEMFEGGQTAGKRVLNFDDDNRQFSKRAVLKVWNVSKRRQCNSELKNLKEELRGLFA
ncbi:hypothetical protein ACOSQ2_029261 [Xanthoceras sorbifolium]